MDVKSLLRADFFRNAKVLAGAEGLHRRIKSVSVADVKISRVNDKESLFPEGGLFLTCLEQFEQDEKEEVEKYFDTLIKYKCSCLLVTGRNKLIDADIVKKCNDAGFPVILFPKSDTPYLEIMQFINRYIMISDISLLRSHTFARILSSNPTEEECIDLLNSLSTSIQSRIRVICFIGEYHSDMLEADFQLRSLRSDKETFIDGKEYKYCIVSEDDDAKLNRNFDLSSSNIRDFFLVSHIGKSRAYDKWNIRKAAIEANNACKLAKNASKTELPIPPLSSYGMLFSLENGQELKNFHDEFMKVIHENASPEHKKAIMETVREYVYAKGDFKQAAENLFQHENTVRYRINRLKSWMGLEDDTIQFYEIISLAIKIEQILSK